MSSFKIGQLILKIHIFSSQKEAYLVLFLKSVLEKCTRKVCLKHPSLNKLPFGQAKCLDLGTLRFEL